VTTNAVRKLTVLAVEERRRQFEAGEDWALLDAVDFCARAGMPMPEWLVQAFCDRYVDWCLFRVKSLDDAFKVKRPKKMKLKARERRERLKPQVVLWVLRLQRERRVPFDEALFERVGKQLGIGKTTANKIYYASDNHWRKLLERIVTEETALEDEALAATIT
jgi:hypothetical protein